jgi:ABC-type multidrug transport system fused ATPase/permease subunit
MEEIKLKTLIKIGREAKKYRLLLIIAMISTIILSGLNLTAPRLLSQMTGIVGNGVDDSALSAIVRLAALLLIIFLSRILFRYLSNYLAHKAAWNLVADMRVKTYNCIQSLSLDFFHNKQTGELMSRVVNDTATFELLYAHIIPDMVTNAITLIGVTIILFVTNAKLALLTCIPIPLLLFAGWIFATKIRPYFRVRQKSVAQLNAQLQDSFSGIQEVQAFNQQQRESVKIYDCCKEFTKSMLKALNLSAVFHPGVEFLTSLGTVIVVGFGGYLAFQQQLSVPEIVSFLLYLSLFYAPITGLTNMLEQAQEALAGAERVLEILETESAIKDRKDAAPLTGFKGEVSFENVSFSYQDGVPVLKNISFTAKPGKMIALVGPTGVGKTTLINLVSRFYDPVEGSVCFDGKDVRCFTADSVRAGISMVLQDTFLFNGTVADNIAYARPDASPEEIVAAAKIARIHDNIQEMPMGYNTQVGERGTKLSGGQKQRIAIARAILRNTPLLILDEATSSVDVKTEAEIQRALGDIMKNHTTIAIAHRLSTVRKADLILVFKDGEIVQSGTHEELICQDGLYRELSISQDEAALLASG